MSITLEVFNIIRKEQQRLHLAYQSAYADGGADYEKRMKRIERHLKKWRRRESRWIESDNRLTTAILRWKTR